MRRLTVALATAALSLTMTSGASKAAPVQWSGNGHWYEVVAPGFGVDWPTAKAGAEARGGYLATLTSGAENQFIFNTLVNNPGVWASGFASPFENQSSGPWIGLFQKPGSAEPAGGWEWVNNEGPLVYANWDAFAPDNFGGVNQDAALFYDSYINDPPMIKNEWNDWQHTNGAPSYLVEYNQSPVPLPAALPMFLSALAGLGIVARRKAS